MAAASAPAPAPWSALHTGQGVALEGSSWRAIAAAKRAALAAQIPARWLLAGSDLVATVRSDADATGVVKSCGLLTARQLEITELDDAEVLLERLASQQYSALEVADAFSARAAIAHQLTNCLTETMFELAVQRAKELDDHLRKTGELVGPLHGLPISLKDQFDVEGVDSSMGFVSLVGKPATRNCVLVDILLGLGAVVYCKTNLPQTMMAAETNNNVFGRTLNPLNLGLTSGGSSGGEGALLALKGSILGVGSDFGGSIRVPSLCCGLYGLRPTTRRVPYAGASNVFVGFEGIESTVGPMARSISSLEVFMKAVIGARPWLLDPKVLPLPWQPQNSDKRLHVAFCIDNGMAHSHPPVRRAILDTVAALRAAGHEVTEMPAFDFAAASRMVGVLAGADGGADLRTFFEDTNEPVVPEAFPLVNGTPLSVYELSQAQAARDNMRRHFHQLWRSSARSSADNRPFDLVLCPVAPHLAWAPRGHPHEPELNAWTTTWSLLDLPACTLPVGEIDAEADVAQQMPRKPFSAFDTRHWNSYDPRRFVRAPLVVQLVSPRRFHDDLLIAHARIVEAAIKNHA